jgi:hypothetical protein
MSMPNPADITAWHVTGQNEQTQVEAGGNPVRGVQVYYQTAAGHTGSVFVPYAQYTTDNVRSLIGTAAAQMDAVGMLTGGPAGT